MPDLPFLCQFIDRIEEAQPDILGDVLAERSLTDVSSDARKVLMLTNNYDPEANLVGIGLRNKGIDYVRLKIGDIPRKLLIRYNIDDKSGKAKLNFWIQKQLLDSSKVSVVWLRNFGINEINFGGNDLARTFSVQQWDNAFQIIEGNLKCIWISSALATRQANDRAKQLSTAKGMGFGIPPTLITNDPKAARDFYDYHDGNVVLKSLQHHSVQLEGRTYSMYTRKILKQELSKLGDLIYAPCILQRRLAIKSELRVTVVGERVFAVRLECESISSRYDDIHRCPLTKGNISEVKMVDSINESCIKLVKSLGLKYGAIDLIVDRKDRLTFLEVNATGDWYWVESKVKLPITKAMVDLIASHI